MKIRNKKVLYLTQAGLIAAVYVVLTVILAAISFGEVQLRVAEMLTILPFFIPAAIPGLFLGCIIGNVLGGAILPDIIFGSLATLAGAFLTYLIGKWAWNKGEAFAKRIPVIALATIPPIAANTLVVPFVLKYGYGVPLPIPFMMLTVFAGEVISCGVLGTVLGKVLCRYRRYVFAQ